MCSCSCFLLRLKFKESWHLSPAVTACEPSAMSEPVVVEPPKAGGTLESCGAGDRSASLDDGIVDTAKYVNKNALQGLA